MDIKKENLYIGVQDLEISKELSTRLVLNVSTKKLEMTLIVNPNTTLQVIRDNWYRIERLKNQLIDIQGSNMERMDVVYPLKLLGKHESGMSYREIAEEVNYDILFGLCRGVLRDRDGIEPIGYSHAFLLMTNLMMKEQDALDYIGEAVTLIEKNILPFDVTTGPITPSRVRDTIRQVKRKIDDGKVVIKKPPKTRSIIAGHFHKANPYWLKTKEFIEQLETNIDKPAL